METVEFEQLIFVGCVIDPLMYLINEQLDHNTKETNQNISNLSLMVVLKELFPNHFIQDLKKISKK